MRFERDVGPLHFYAETMTNSSAPPAPFEVLDLASRIFDMARSGDAATLAAYLDAGVPVNLTNTNGDTLVMWPPITDTSRPSPH